MYGINSNEGSDDLGTLLKETVNGFGHLVADHIKLARLELFADVKTLGRRVALLAVVVCLVLLGYVFCCLGLAVVVSRWMGLSGGLGLLGGLHLIGGTTALLFAMRGMRGMHWMHGTTREMGQSVSALTTHINNRTASAAAAPECTASDRHQGLGAITSGIEGESHIVEARP